MKQPPPCITKWQMNCCKGFKMTVPERKYSFSSLPITKTLSDTLWPGKLTRNDDTIISLRSTGETDYHVAATILWCCPIFFRMFERGMKPDVNTVLFGQIMGMRDHISFSLGIQQLQDVNSTYIKLSLIFNNWNHCFLFQKTLFSAI